VGNLLNSIIPPSRKVQYSNPISNQNINYTIYCFIFLLWSKPHYYWNLNDFHKSTTTFINVTRITSSHRDLSPSSFCICRLELSMWLTWNLWLVNNFSHISSPITRVLYLSQILNQCSCKPCAVGLLLSMFLRYCSTSNPLPYVTRRISSWKQNIT